MYVYVSLGHIAVQKKLKELHINYTLIKKNEKKKKREVTDWKGGLSTRHS